jgi:hypothetical protein
VTLRLLPLLALLFTAGGCGFLFKSPSKANVALRKENQDLQDQLARLQRQHAADEATIRGLGQPGGAVPALDPARLGRLFTVHSIRLGRLTGGADLDPNHPGHEGLKIYVNLLDQHGDAFKASGSFVVEAFDLSDQARRLGRWEFPADKSQDYWHSFLTRYEYVLPCPWQQSPPRHPDVTVRVQFTDELTGRQFVEQRVAKVDVPPPTPTAPAGTQPVGLRD